MPKDMPVNGVCMTALVDGIKMDSAIVYTIEDMQAFILDALATEPYVHVTIDGN